MNGNIVSHRGNSSASNTCMASGSSLGNASGKAGSGDTGSAGDLASTPHPNSPSAGSIPAVKNPLPMLAVLYGAAFVAAFNENIVNVALLDIMAEFAVSSVTAQWLVTGYMIVTTIVVTAMAFLSRRFGLRTLFFAGAVLFLVGSLADIVAPTFSLLLGFRLMQALGTGVFIPAMMNAVLALAPRRRLGTFLSLGGCCITLGPAFGPVVSGVMTTCFGWRSAFVPSCVIMTLLMVAGALFVRNVGERQRPRLDALSLVLSAVGLTAFVYGLTQVSSHVGRGALGLVVGAVLVALFVRRQGRIDNPVMNMRPLKNPRFGTACALTVVAMMTTFSMSVLLPLYFQGALLESALASGALILVPIAVNAVTALVAGRIMDKRGAWPLLPAGFALIAVGQVVMCVVCQRLDLVLVVAAATVVYAGVGLVFSPSQTAGLRQLDARENPHGVAIMSTFVQMAGCMGPSLFVGIMSASVDHASALGASAEVAQAAGFGSAQVVAALIALAGLAVAFVYARKAREPLAQGPAGKIGKNTGLHNAHYWV